MNTTELTRIMLDAGLPPQDVYGLLERHGKAMALLADQLAVESTMGSGWPGPAGGPSNGRITISVPHIYQPSGGSCFVGPGGDGGNGSDGGGGGGQGGYSSPTRSAGGTGGMDTCFDATHGAGGGGQTKR